MNNLIPANTHYLLEVSIEDLHWESRDWLSEIRSWQEEVAFYQKLLNKMVGRVKTEEAKKKWDHYQAMLNNFQTNILHASQRNLEDHEDYLFKLVVNKAQVDDQLYREVHKKYAGQVKDFATNFKLLKKDLFGFIEHAS
jgi:hypothetical protein